MKKIKFSSLKVLLGSVTGLLILISLIITIGIFINQNRKLAYDNAVKDISSQLENAANNISNTVNTTLEEIRITKTYLQRLKSYKTLSRQAIIPIIKQQTLRNPNYFAVGITYLPGYFDGKSPEYRKVPGYYDDGRFAVYWYTENDSLILYDPVHSWDEEMLNGDEWWEIPKETKEAYFYVDLFTLKNKKVLMLTAVEPIIEKGKFIGVINIDYRSDFMQKLALNLSNSLYKHNTFVEIISDNGEIAANSKVDTLIGKHIKQVYPNKSDEILKNIENARILTYSKNDTVYHSVPISFNGYNKKWYLQAAIPEPVIMHEANEAMKEQIKLGLIIIVISILIVVLILSFVLKPLSNLTKLTKKITSGRLDVEIKTGRKDEIGELSMAFRQMIDKIREIVTGIRSNAMQIANGSNEIARSSQSIAQGANQQAASTEEVSSAIEEMLSSIEQNSQNANFAQQIATKAEKGILDGQEAMKATVKAMEEIAKEIVMITEIAEKTDLLAINAAVEAARAGHKGKGFSVVASEIRTLAEDAQSIAVKIVNLAQNGLVVAKNSGEVLKTTVPDVQKTSRIIQEISAASNEQNSGAAQINTAVNQLNEVTQSNTSTSEELASGSEELANQANILKEMVSFFIINESDSSSKLADMKKQMTDLMQMINDFESEQNNKTDFQQNKYYEKEPENNEHTKKKELYTNSDGINIKLDSENTDSDFENF